MKGLSRRRFLKRGLKLGAGAIFLGGCASPVLSDPDPEFLALATSTNVGRVNLGRFAPGAWREACEWAISQTTDLSWLTRGDSVFLKVASNSPYPHPSVTSPEAVVAVTEFLRAHGASEVLVGDQAGVEHVRLTREGRVSATRAALKENGILAAAESCGAKVHCFDDQGWDGYFQAETDFADHWEGGLWLPKVLNDVDHVINLPRLASHALAGYTCAVKIAVGWLRDDSRQHLHQRAASFFEQIAEISHAPAIREKLRFSLTLGDQALLSIGPDIGSKYDLQGVVALGAVNPVDHDLLASAMLTYFDRDDTSAFDLYAPYPEDSNHWNEGFVEDIWGEEAAERYTPMRTYELEKGLAYDRCLAHMAKLQAYRPPHIQVERRGELDPELITYLRGFGEGAFALA